MSKEPWPKAGPLKGTHHGAQNNVLAEHGFAGSVVALCWVRLPIGQSTGGSGIRACGRIILGIAKPLGAIALLVPGIARVKEWAYAGFAIAWICAFIAHYLAFRSAGIAGATGRLLFDPPCEPALSRYGHTELDVDRLSGRAWRWLQRCSFFG